MKVLVTRPQPAADALASALRKSGDVVVVCPAFAIVACAPGDAQMANVKDADCFVFVSANAVCRGWQYVEPRAADCDVLWCAVGPTTARALSLHDVRVVAPAGPGSSAALLALPPMQSVAGSRVVIVRGVGGLETLHTVLGDRGARVDTLEVYARVVAPAAALAETLVAGVDAVVVSSGEGLAAVLAAAQHSVDATTALAAATVVVPSARVFAQARRAGLVRVVASSAADDAAMLAAVHSVRGKYG